MSTQQELDLRYLRRVDVKLEEAMREAMYASETYSTDKYIVRLRELRDEVHRDIMALQGMGFSPAMEAALRELHNAVGGMPFEELAAKVAKRRGFMAHEVINAWKLRYK